MEPEFPTSLEREQLAAGDPGGLPGNGKVQFQANPVYSRYTTARQITGTRTAALPVASQNTRQIGICSLRAAHPYRRRIISCGKAESDCFP
ncbi:MAG: hypothetical protein OXK72_09045 [Gammaproteobacteria bacterium]|nr:hypothetical protein [Gammaproteobacteria bacterium]